MWGFLRVIMMPFLLCLVGGCVSPKERMHWNLGVWLYQINDGHGSTRPLFSKYDYYETMARALLDKHESVRTTVARDFTTGVTAAGHRYVYSVDAYIDEDRDEMLEAYLRKAWGRAPPDSNERLQILKALVQLGMRRYLWANPGFGKQHGIDRDKPQRGFRPFWLHHYPIFADRLLAEGDEGFARDWEEYRRLMRQRHGHDPARN